MKASLLLFLGLYKLQPNGWFEEKDFVGFAQVDKQNVIERLATEGFFYIKRLSLDEIMNEIEYHFQRPQGEELERQLKDLVASIKQKLLDRSREANELIGEQLSEKRMKGNEAQIVRLGIEFEIEKYCFDLGQDLHSLLRNRVFLKEEIKSFQRDYCRDQCEFIFR